MVVAFYCWVAFSLSLPEALDIPSYSASYLLSLNVTCLIVLGRAMLYRDNGMLLP